MAEKGMTSSCLVSQWINEAAIKCFLKPKCHLARHASRLDTTRHVRRRVKRVEPFCSNMADDEQAINILLACTSLVVLMLLGLYIHKSYVFRQIK